MQRATDGKRHEIILQYATSGRNTRVQAVCICEKLNAPPRFDRTKAEEDGREHLYTAQRQGRPRAERK